MHQVRNHNEQYTENGMFDNINLVVSDQVYHVHYPAAGDTPRTIFGYSKFRIQPTLEYILRVEV